MLDITAPLHWGNYNPFRFSLAARTVLEAEAKARWGGGGDDRHDHAQLALGKEVR